MTAPRRLALRIEPELGHIDTHAKMLVAIADATGREVRELFNGIDLVARPGDTPEHVSQSWWLGRDGTVRMSRAERLGITDEVRQIRESAEHRMRDLPDGV